ncbi:hypothetical protein PGQ11_000425 [Apiospora arundinis]
MAGGTDHTRRSSIGPKTRTFLEWAAGGKLPSKTSSSRRHRSTSSAGGEDKDDERRRSRHHGERSSGVHKHSSSEVRRSSSHKGNSSSSSHHPKSSSSTHHRSSSRIESGCSKRKDRPGYYTSYSSAPSMPREPRESRESRYSAAPSSSSSVYSVPSSCSYGNDNVGSPSTAPSTPYRSDFASPSTAPTTPYKSDFTSPSTAPTTPYRSSFGSASTAPSTIPEEDEDEQSDGGSGYISDDARQRAATVGPWDSVSMTSVTPSRYTAFVKREKKKWKDPQSDDGAASEAVPPVPKYRHGSEVPWGDSVYHSSTAASSSVSKSKSRRPLPSYTSHDYVHSQQQQPSYTSHDYVHNPQQATAAYAAVDPQAAYTMNSAYATMPGYGGHDSGYVDDYSNSYGYDGGGGDGGFVEQSDRVTYEYEEEGERRRIRGTRERTTKKRASRGAG